VSAKIFVRFFTGNNSVPGKRFPAKKQNPEKLFPRARNFRKYFPGKFVHTLTRQPELFPTTQKRGKTSKNP